MAKQKTSNQLSATGTLLGVQAVHSYIDYAVVDISAGTFEINVVSNGNVVSRGRFSSPGVIYFDEFINPGDTVTLTEPTAATGSVTLVFTTG